MKIFIPENNLGHEGVHLRNMLKKHSDVRTFWQKKDKPGICKDAHTADYYVADMDENLRLNRLRFSTNLFTNTTGQTSVTAKARMQEEFERYHVELKRARSEFEKTRRVVTGKGGGDTQDDVAIATMQCSFWGKAAAAAPSSCLV